MNQKNKKYLIILAVAVLVAVIAALAVWRYLSPQKSTIFVFNDTYQAGEVLDSSMLTPVQVDSTMTVAGKKTNTSDKFITQNEIGEVLNSADSLRMDVATDMPLTYSMLTISGGSSVEVNMDPSKIAVSVPVTNITGVTSELKEGSRVNIYSTGIGGSGITLFLQNMRIIAVAKDGNNALSSVTLECSQNEALKVVYAATYSSIHLGLVDAAGYEYVEGEPAYAPGAEGEGFEASSNLEIETIPLDNDGSEPETKEDEDAAEDEETTPEASDETEETTK